jgi:hypothetical protein
MPAGVRVGGSSTSPPITFSMRIARSPCPIAVTVSWSSWQIVMTTSDPRIIRVSAALNSVRNSCEPLKRKLLNCCGRLECMSYRCGIPISFDSQTPTRPISSCEWMAS